MRRAAWIATVALAPFAMLSLSACDKGADRASSSAGDYTAPPKVVRDDLYEGVLGVIASLPVEGNPASELRIHHEHIPTFKTKDGQVNMTADGVAGMKSMVMPFPVAEGLDISPLKIGDKVRFDFAVHWGGDRVWEITAFEIIDPDTEIDFSNKLTDPAMPDEHSGHDHDGAGDHADAPDAAEDHTGHDHP